MPLSWVLGAAARLLEIELAALFSLLQCCLAALLLTALLLLLLLALVAVDLLHTSCIAAARRMRSCRGNLSVGSSASMLRSAR